MRSVIRRLDRGGIEVQRQRIDVREHRRPPSKMKQFAVATKAIGDVITSSPSCTPAMWHSMCSPAVPLETAAA